MFQSGEASDGLHHGSPMVVKLEVGRHQGGYIREHEGSRGGGASDEASPPNVPHLFLRSARNIMGTRGTPK